MNEGVYEDHTFEEVYKMYTPFVLKIENNISIKFSLNREDREDLRQILYMQLFKAFNKYDIDRNVGFGQYMTKVLNNTSYMYLRNLKKVTKFNALSLDYEYQNQDEEGKYDTLLDFNIGEDNTEQLADLITLREKLLLLTEYERRLLYDRYELGMSEVSLAKKYFTTQCCISRKLIKINKMLKEEIESGYSKSFRRNRRQDEKRLRKEES